MSRKSGPETPDGRYFVARGRLWRKGDPSLSDSTRRAAIKALMQARHAEGQAINDAERRAARDAITAAKCRLGEAGSVWWDDGSPDESGLHPADSRYRDWWHALDAESRARGEHDPRRF
jgi:hypothetical protein